MNIHDFLSILHNIIIFAVFLIIAAKVAIRFETKNKSNNKK